MNKRPSSNFVKVGSLAQRIACRLIARRQAEILLNRGETPAEHGQRHQARQPTTNAAQDRAVGRLNEKSRHVLSGKGGVRGGIGRVCAHPGENVIYVAARVWGTGRAGTVPIRPCVKVRSPSHLPFSDENSEPLNISTARGSAYQGTHCGYWRRSSCLFSACMTVVWSRLPNTLPIFG
jgi:hypothetical protein